MRVSTIYISILCIYNAHIQYKNENLGMTFRRFAETEVGTVGDASRAPEVDIFPTMNIDRQDPQDLVLGIWCLAILGIRNPPPDHLPSRLPVQEPLVLLILFILYIDVNNPFSGGACRRSSSVSLRGPSSFFVSLRGYLFSRRASLRHSLAGGGTYFSSPSRSSILRRPSKACTVLCRSSSVCTPEIRPPGQGRTSTPLQRNPARALC